MQTFLQRLRSRVLIAALISSLTLLAGALLPAPVMAEPASSPSSTALITLLKDETARNALIADLERAAAKGAESTAPDTTPSVPQASLGRRVAEFTQGIAENAAERGAALWDELMASRNIFAGLTGDEFGILIQAATDLALVLVLTVAVFLVLRRTAIPFYRRMGEAARGAGLLRASMLFLGGSAMDAMLVITAWALGYLVTLVAVGDLGQIGLRQTLYLNAFLAVELAKVATRSILSPSSGGLRLLPLSDAAARALTRHANILIGVVGYGQLLVVPIINQNVSFLAGRSVSVILSVFVLLYLCTLVLSRRKQVSEWIIVRLSASVETIVQEIEAAEDADPALALEQTPAAPRRGIVPTLARHWHWAALTYLSAMFVVVLTRPTAATLAALEASGKVLMGVIVATIVSAALSRVVARGITLPEDIKARLPLLEKRLNSFVPRVLMILRMSVLAGVALYSLDAVNAIDAAAWLDSPLGRKLTGSAASLAAIGIVSGLVWLAMNSWVDYRLNPEYGNVPTSRETTLLTLLRNAAAIAILVFSGMFALSEVGLDIGPLLASAGVLGLAIGFGSQKLVQDIITGVFIQFENAINVGDVVTVGGITGTVEKLTVRSVSLRDVHACFHIIPFSAVSSVSNFTRDFSYFVSDMGVAYRENVDEVKQAMFDAFEELRSDPAHGASILADLEWLGLNGFMDSSVVLRARIKTIPGKQWATGRAYNAIIKRLFDERDIEIPFPHQTIYLGEAKGGRTQLDAILPGKSG